MQKLRNVAADSTKGGGLETAVEYLTGGFPDCLTFERSGSAVIVKSGRRHIARLVEQSRTAVRAEYNRTHRLASYQLPKCGASQWYDLLADVSTELHEIGSA